MSGERIETAGGVREQIARALGLVDGAVSVPLSGRYGRYADAVLPLIAEAEARGAREMRAQIVADLRTKFGLTNRAADYLSRKEHDRG